MDAEETRKYIDQQSTASSSTFNRIVSEGPIFGIVGIVTLKNAEFLCVIKRADEVARLMLPGSPPVDGVSADSDKAKIYKISEVKFYPMKPLGTGSLADEVNQVDGGSSGTPVYELVQRMKRYLADGFYFTYSQGERWTHIDLTVSLQRRWQQE